MPVVKLTSALLASLKDGEPIELWDQLTTGLCLRLRSTREKATWSFRYRPKEGGGYARVTLGRLKDMSLADARVKATALRSAVNDGTDPGKVKRQTRETAKLAMRFDKLAESYVESYAKLNKKSWKQDEILLKRPREKWKNKRPEELRRADISELLLEIAKTAPVSANRTKTVLVKVFNWAVDAGHMPANPAAGMKRIAKEEAKERTLNDAELRVFWNALNDSESITHDVADALRLTLLLGARPGEVAGLEQIELVDVDKPKEARIEIPAAKMKGGRPHVIPIAPMARAIVLAALARRVAEGEESALLASRYFDRSSLARHSLSHALRRILPALKVTADTPPDDAKAIASLQANPPTPHDLRRSTASGMSRLGVPPEDRRAVLGHGADDLHGRVYDRYDRLAEKRRALETWEAHLASVLDRGEPSDESQATTNVVALLKRRTHR